MTLYKCIKLEDHLQRIVYVLILIQIGKQRCSSWSVDGDFNKARRL